MTARTIVLSIVGADKSTTQFHEFVGQILEWNIDGGKTSIIDVPTQPIDTSRDRASAP